MSRIIRMLTAATAVGGLALSGLVMAGAASASTPGTTGPGSWSFDPGNGSNAIQVPTTLAPVTSTSTAYQAQVQQPINADGSSVFNHKSSTIPVQFKVQKQTVTTTKTTTTDGVYPDTLKSDGTVPYNNVVLTPPPGTTVSQISNLTADFTWQAGNNQQGSLRWSIGTPDGNVFVYYGDLSSTFQTGNGGSGENMMTTGEARYEGNGSFVGMPEYDTLADLLNRPAPAGTIGNEPVSFIALVVDSGTGQTVKLSDVQITDNAGTSEYVPGTVPGSTTTSTTTGPLVTDNSAPAWISITKTSGATPAGAIDESTLTSTQGDSGGQYRQVDSKYMYNLPVNDLPDPSATYTVGVSFHSDGSSPVPNTVKFGLK
jgi:hypothetical protein